MSRLRVRVGASVVAVAGLIVVAACGGGGDPASVTVPPTAANPSDATDEFGPFQVLAGSTLVAGEQLPAGLVVPEGSNILGATFPDVDGAGGYLALGLVVGDPVAVFNDYVAQANGLGMSVSDAGGCLPSGDVLACLRAMTDPSDGERLQVRIERRPAPAGHISHVALRYQPPGSVDTGAIGGGQPSPPTAPIVAPALPEVVEAPDPGAWNRSVAPFSPPLPLARDSRLVGQPGPCGCAERGWSAVIRVDGDPAEVLAAYAAQVTGDAPEPDSAVVDGRRVLSADLGLAASGFVQLRVVEDTDATWLLVAVAQL